MSPINFRQLEIVTGSKAGARDAFEKLVTSIVRLEHREARALRPDPGDWGIDVVAGSLDGTNMVWQAKYFTEGVGKTQKSQIRDSLDSLLVQFLILLGFGSCFVVG